MKLSIIIPVYNTEKYLEACIESVLKQDTKEQFEVILIDDGSKDQSPQICDQYAQKYDFITTLHISNSGPATAKNKGYEIAKGEYISFIDSDDKITPQMYDTMLKSANDNNADVVCCSYEQIDEKGISSHNKFSGKEYVLNQVEGLKHLLEKNMIYSQCWTKIYKKEVLERYHILYVNGLKTEEDFIYNLQVFLKSQIITIVDFPLYIYTHREASLSRDYFKSNLEQFHKNMIYRLEMTDREIREQYPQLLRPCIAHCILYYNLLIGRAAMFKYKDSQPYYTKAIKYIKKNITTLLRNHTKCGFSIIGSFILFVLPPSLYFRYRKHKIN